MNNDTTLMEQENQSLLSMLTIHKAQFTGIFETSAIGMAIVSTQGHWIKVNDSLLRILGYTREQLLTKTFQDVTHPDDLAADLHLLKEVLDGHRISYQVEKRYFNNKGEIIWALIAVSIVKDENNKPLHFVSQIIDITESKRLAHLHLSHADQQNSRIAFALHEDIAQTLASIKLFLNSAAAERVSRPETFSLVDARLGELIKDVTALSERIMPNTFIYENLYDLVQGLVVKYSMQSSLNIHVHLDKSLQTFASRDGFLVFRLVDELWQLSLLMEAFEVELRIYYSLTIQIYFSFHTKTLEEHHTTEQNLLCSNIKMRVEMLTGSLEHQVATGCWSWHITIRETENRK